MNDNDPVPGGAEWLRLKNGIDPFERWGGDR